MRIAQKRGFEDAIFIRLFRLWSMARESHEPAVPAMHEEASKHGYKDQAAPACSSLFELVEGHLGRPLRRECCCSPRFSADERALLGILRATPSLNDGKGSPEGRQGLPGAISWAASSVCDAMGIVADPALVALQSSAANKQDYPFGIPAQKGRAHGI